ncbi:MAG: tRNA pseudouridine(38-40) synthase TruA [Cyclobacteriaceae bacterium]
MEELQRYFMEVAYNGSNYHGWQFQKNASSVQETIQKALMVLFQIPTPVMGSGRTDAGVHARQQFLHFDYAGDLGQTGFLKRMNGVLPHDIVANNLIPVVSNAHARFDAVWRKYEYHIHFRKDPFLCGQAWHCYYPLDQQAMEKAANLLLNYTDFQAFSRTKTEVKSFDCKIKSIYWERIDHGLIFHIEANRFLRGMVRAIVGTLVKVGRGMSGEKEFVDIILSKKRTNAGSAVPPQGLFLSRVTYPERIFKKTTEFWHWKKKT